VNKEEVISVIESFLPKKTANTVADYLLSKSVNLKIVNDRKTKLGDFRVYRDKSKKRTITINGGLNEYEFLITLVHEFAHLEVFEKYSRGVKPHGEEWKEAYRGLMIEYFELDVFPNELAVVLLKHLRNPKASSHGDLKLVKALSVFDEKEEDDSLYLEDLQLGDRFFINGKILIKGEKRRTRYMCIEQGERRRFTVSALAKVVKY